MGTVFEAIDQRLDTTVALKETLFADERLRRQFEREARLLARLHHPALPRVSDHFSEGDGQFLVMQYIAGDDLSEMLSKRNGPFPSDQVLSWTDQLLDALDYLHTQEPQIIHRDIKPQNLKLTTRGQIILLDFGLAKGQVGDLSRPTTTASIFGYTPNYAPLEQIQGLGTDPRSDIYALSATVYHLMTGVKPPDALTRAAALVNGQPDPLVSASEANSAVSGQVSEVLQRAMAQNREQRYRSAAEMRRSLGGADQPATATSRAEAATVLFPASAPEAAVTQAIAAHETIIKQKTTPISETTVVRAPAPKSRYPLAIAASAVLLCLGLGGFYAYQRSQAPVTNGQSASGSQATPSASPSPPASAPSTSSPEETAVVEQDKKTVAADKKTVAADKKAVQEEKAARAAESEANRKKRETAETEMEDRHQVVPDEPETPDRDFPEPPAGNRPRVRRAGGAVIRNLPDGTQVITAPDGSRVVITPEGRRRIIRRGSRGPRTRTPYP
jgi:serine/threonine protein kinase